MTLSAVASGTKDVKDIVSKAQSDQKMFQAKTILFLDEIHRFNKAQQVYSYWVHLRIIEALLSSLDSHESELIIIRFVNVSHPLIIGNTK